MKKRSIAIDMDNVIADVATHFINWYEKDSGVRIEKEAMLGVREESAFPPNVIRNFLFTPGFFRTVPLIEGAQEAVRSLMEHFEVYIVSAAMEFPLSLGEKREWLVEHFPFIPWRNIIFCGDKSIIATDFLLDDHCKNLDTCKGKALLFTAGHNIHVSHHHRLNNWKEVIDFMRRN